MAVPEYLLKASKTVSDTATDQNVAANAGTLTRQFIVKKAQEEQANRTAGLKALLGTTAETKQEASTPSQNTVQQILSAGKTKATEYLNMAKGVGQSVEDLSKKSTGEQIKAGFTAIPKVAKGAVEEVASGVKDVVIDAPIEQFKAMIAQGDSGARQVYDFMKAAVKGEIDWEGWDTKVSTSAATEEARAKADETGAVPGLATSLEGLSKITSIAPTPQIQALSGALNEVSQGLGEVESGEKGLTEVATEAVISATARATFAKFIDKLTGSKLTSEGSKKKLMEDASKAGLGKPEVKILSEIVDPDEASFVKKLWEQSKKAADEGVETKTATDLVAEEKLGTAMKTLDDMKSAAGEEVGMLKQSLKDKNLYVKVDKPYQTFLDAVTKKLNAKVGDDGLIDWSTSSIRDQATNKKILDSVWEAVKPDANGNNLRQVDDLIADIESVNGNLYAGSVDSSNLVFGTAETIASTMKNELKDALVTLDPKVSGVYKKFADLADITSKVKSVIGNDYSKGADLLRRSMGAGASKNKNILQDLIDFSKANGVTDGVNLLKEIQVAKKLDDIAGVVKPTSFKSGIQEGVEAVVKKSPTIQVVDKLAKFITPDERKILDKIMAGKDSSFFTAPKLTQALELILSPGSFTKIKDKISSILTGASL